MSTAAIKMKHYYETEGEETRRGELMGYATGMTRACLSHAERERKECASRTKRNYTIVQAK